MLQLMVACCLDLQKHISKCETRVTTNTNILHEDELVLFSIKHEFSQLDGAIESSK
jgi:hypothetical protein